MRFIEKGPNIPEKLLYEHEDGRVAFFCGAGVSVPAGLPLFRRLTRNIVRRIGGCLSQVEMASYKEKQFEVVLDLLEKRPNGGRERVRKALHDELNQMESRPELLSTHSALLQLATSRQGKLRLVTTNYDRLFDESAKNLQLNIPSYNAPLLPMPKRSKWHGIIYLHGLLPSEFCMEAMSKLVVTSGDFGLAYLTERWASRFVTEFLKNYTVCFVGYSINDQVIRYILDALAADRASGEESPEAYAFADYSGDNQKPTELLWRSKGVVPIMYQAFDNNRDHSRLHTTLQEWAKTYQDEVHGKELVVRNLRTSGPSGSTQEDSFVEKVLWALHDSSGIPARIFSEQTPVPPLDWLTVFEERILDRDDLELFGIHGSDHFDAELRFNYLDRPSPSHLASRMAILRKEYPRLAWDSRMEHMARWLLRHLNNPELLLWVSSNGGRLSARFRDLIQYWLDRISSLSRTDDSEELALLREDSPDSIPDSLMWKLWQLVVDAKMYSVQDQDGLSDWSQEVRKAGLSTTLRLRFRSCLEPRLNITRRISYTISEDESENNGPDVDPRSILEIQIEPGTMHLHTVAQNIREDSWLEPYMIDIMSECQQALYDSLRLAEELGVLDEMCGYSFFYMPSIAPHWQNHHQKDWAFLIEMLRDSWLKVLKVEKHTACYLVKRWFDSGFSPMRRLALFAASQDDCVDKSLWINWLLINNGKILWDIEMRREVCRLIVLQGQHLDETELNLLERAILERYRESLDLSGESTMKDYAIWLFLAKLEKAGCSLGMETLNVLTQLRRKNPKWEFNTHEREEFSSWMSGTGTPDYEDNLVIDHAPRKLTELKEWLLKPVTEVTQHVEDTWKTLCVEEPGLCAQALLELCETGDWVSHRWMEAFYAWSDIEVPEPQKTQLIRYFPLCINTIGTNVIHSFSWWLSRSPRPVTDDAESLHNAYKFVLDFPTDPVVLDGNILFKSINHQTGLITGSLFKDWYFANPRDDEGLPHYLKVTLSELCNTPEYIFPKVIIGINAISLYRADKEWSQEHLIPLFNWSVSETDAKAVWVGFLRNGRLHGPILRALSSYLELTATYSRDLGDYEEKYAEFVTLSYLNRLTQFKDTDMRGILSNMSPKGLESVIRACARSIEVHDDHSEYWASNVKPLLALLPISRDFPTPSMSSSYALLCIELADIFTEVFSEVRFYLAPLQHPNYTLNKFCETDVPEKYPNEAFEFVSLILGRPRWLPPKLGDCLERIRQADSALAKTEKYRDLERLFRLLS